MLLNSGNRQDYDDGLFLLGLAFGAYLAPIRSLWLSLPSPLVRLLSRHAEQLADNLNNFAERRSLAIRKVNPVNISAYSDAVYLARLILRGRAKPSPAKKKGRTFAKRTRKRAKGARS